MIRRLELRLIVPLADSTIFEMEKRGEFPPRFNLSPRCPHCNERLANPDDVRVPK
jgi:hypothetical protein